jgi:pyruvate,water dikinase
MKPDIIFSSNVAMDQLADVGGKNASLGEMIPKLSPLGIAAPDGFILL